MPRKHIFITEPFPEQGLVGFENDFTWNIGPTGGPASDEEFLQLLGEAEGCLLVGNDLSGEVIKKAPCLRAVTRFGIGYNGVNLAAATQKGILICNTPESTAQATADLAFGLLLATARRIPDAQNYVRSGEWARTKANFPLTKEVYGRTLGIIGFGRIGKAVARRGAGFGMRILYCDLVPAPEMETAIGAKQVDLAQLLIESDFVSVHVPLTEQTHRLLGKYELETMKKDAILINTSRGLVLDQKALYEMLRDRRIAAAGLDVFETEPLQSDDPLTTLDNVVLLPHMGTGTLATRILMAKEALTNLKAALIEGKPQNVVNSEVLMR